MAFPNITRQVLALTLALLSLTFVTDAMACPGRGGAVTPTPEQQQTRDASPRYAKHTVPHIHATKDARRKRSCRRACPSRERQSHCARGLVSFYLTLLTWYGLGTLVMIGFLMHHRSRRDLDQD